MDNTYTILENLCNTRNITINEMCKSSGVRAGIITDLKMGRTKKLSANTLEKLAKYFGVSVDYLLGNEQKNTPNTVASVEGIDLTQSEEEIIKLLRQMDKDQIIKAILALQKIISDVEDGKDK